MPEEVVEKQESKMSQMASEFSTFCYNSDEGTVMGRTGTSWLKITGFYIIFYSCLACFFGVCLHVALMTIPDDRPKLVGRSNRPTVSPATKIFRELDFTKSMEKYEGDVSAFINEYDGINKNATGTVMTIGDNDRYSDCVPGNGNYVAGEKGCVFMNINRRFDWVPEDGDHIVCAWDVGLGGTGSLNPGFTVNKIRPIAAGEALSRFYPWSSKAVNGEQPVWAIQVIKNGQPTSAETTTTAEEAFLKCGIVNTAGKGYEDYASYIFTIIYKPDA